MVTTPGLRGMPFTATVKATGYKESNTRYPASRKPKEMRGSWYLLMTDRPAIVSYLLHQDCNSLKDKKHERDANPSK